MVRKIRKQLLDVRIHRLTEEIKIYPEAEVKWN